ncbi:hypothetical protein R3I94_006991 [Phoxinus phoxinus]
MAAEIIKDLKWKVTLEQLNRLRETNPEIPMASTLDIMGGLNTAAEVPSCQQDDDFFQLLISEFLAEFWQRNQQKTNLRVP